MASSLSCLALCWHLLRVYLFLNGDLLVLFVKLLLCAGHRCSNHAAHILSLLVYLLHVLARCQHLVLRHAAHGSRGTHTLLSLSFALLAATLIEGRVQLYQQHKVHVR